MTSSEIWLSWSLGRRVDGLCPRCWMPALWQSQLLQVTEDGVTTTRWACRWCADCRIRIPIKETK